MYLAVKNHVCLRDMSWILLPQTLPIKHNESSSAIKNASLKFLPLLTTTMPAKLTEVVHHRLALIEVLIPNLDVSKNYITLSRGVGEWLG